MKSFKKLFKHDKEGKSVKSKKSVINPHTKISAPVLLEKPPPVRTSVSDPMFFSSPEDAYNLRIKKQNLFLHKSLPLEILNRIFEYLHPVEIFSSVRLTCRVFDDIVGAKKWSHLQLDLTSCLAVYERPVTEKTPKPLYVPTPKTVPLKGSVAIKARTELQEFSQAIMRGLDKLSGVRQLTLTLPNCQLLMKDYGDVHNANDLPVHIIQRAGNDAFINWIMCWLLTTIIPNRCVNLKNLEIIRWTDSLDSYEPVMKLLSMMPGVRKSISLGQQSTSKIVSQTSNVRSLRLMMGETFDLQPDVRCPTLENLQLVYQSGGKGRVGVKDLEKFLANFPYLNTFQLYGMMVVYEPNDSDRCWLPNSVKTLEIGGVEPCNNQLITFSRVTTLRVLDNVAGRSLLHHMVLPNLRKIAFSDQLVNNIHRVVMPGTEYPDTLPDIQTRYGLSIPLYFFPDTLKEVQAQFGSLSMLLMLVKSLPRKGVEKLVLFDADFPGVEDECNNSDWVSDIMDEIVSYLPNLRELTLFASRQPFTDRTFVMLKKFLKCTHLQSFFVYFGPNLKPIEECRWLVPAQINALTYNTNSNTSRPLDGFTVDIETMRAAMNRPMHRRFKSLFRVI